MQAGSCKSVPRDKSVPKLIAKRFPLNTKTIRRWVANVESPAFVNVLIFNLVLSPDPDRVFFLAHSLVSFPDSHRDPCSVALVLVTITIKVGVVNASISTYLLLSAYFTYKCMHLITRVHSILKLWPYPSLHLKVATCERNILALLKCTGLSKQV